VAGPPAFRTIEEALATARICAETGIATCLPEVVEE
jgi:hypothetical protein